VAPQVPSVVGTPVGLGLEIEEEGDPKTGSPVLVVVEAVVVVVGAGVVLAVVVPVHPL